ncbi:MAG: hypothetical protein KKC68_06425 [Candidatus Thermoplasmatota archaeon]|nr:hypothetical protein [Candidatus Thermoplasmatota archaeon]MBU1941394.1 hypothetical protein [Candidatus Thermoplasmatota archaeon]
MDVIGFIVGFILGVIVVALAIELGMRRSHTQQPTSRPTHTWSIDEIQNPRIIAESLGAIKLPKNARVVVNRYQDKDVLKGIEVKEHPGIRGNYIVGDDRALILSGALAPNALGVWTIEKSMLEKLNGYFEDSWCKASHMDNDEPEA